jgi:hypothetical protein
MRQYDKIAALPSGRRSASRPSEDDEMSATKRGRGKRVVESDRAAKKERREARREGTRAYPRRGGRPTQTRRARGSSRGARRILRNGAPSSRRTERRTASASALTTRRGVPPIVRRCAWPPQSLKDQLGVRLRKGMGTPRQRLKSCSSISFARLRQRSRSVASATLVSMVTPDTPF